MIQPVLPISPESHLQNPSCHIWYHSHRFRGLGHMSGGISADPYLDCLRLRSLTPRSLFTRHHHQITSTPRPAFSLLLPTRKSPLVCFPARWPSPTQCASRGRRLSPATACPVQKKSARRSLCTRVLLTKLRFYLRAERGEGISQRREAERFQTG